MFDRIIAFSIKNKFIVGLMTLALIIWGVWSAGRLPIDAVPDITNNQVQIITVCPTLAGQEVEQLVTYPIEQSVANLPGLEELRSISRFGLSVITVVFEDKVDIYFARQLINEKLKEAEEKIPPGVGKPELAPVSTGLGEVYQYIIHPKKGSEGNYTPMDLRTMQDWIVARQLYGTPGIAEVNSFGGQVKQYEVAVNPARLMAMGVTIPDIFTALQQNNENTGGAYIDKKPNAYFIRGMGLVSSFDDIKNIVVKTNPNGIPILIKDVAEVRFGSAVRYGALTYNGEVDAVGGVVMMLKGANSAEVVSRIKEKMKTIQQSLPPDVVIEPFLDRTDLVNRAISTVETNLIEGALIVIFVLVLFLGNLRAGLIVASAIPLSMLFALGMMNVFGVSANLMSLGAIDFGLIVDGAVIVVEATMHHLGLRKGKGRFSQAEMDHEVQVSASKIRKSAAFGEIIILIVYIPVLTLVGIEGKMFVPMAQTVSFAIFGALILSFTYIPMMCALFLSKKTAHKENFSDRMMKAFYKVYSPLLEKAIRFKTVVIGVTVAVFAFSVFLFSRMGGEFIPTLQEGDFAFHCILPQGTSLSQSLETSMQASRIIKEFDEVKMVVGKTGSAEVPTDPMPPEASDLVIILKSPDEWKRKISYNALADEMMEKLEAIPGVFFEKSQPIQIRFNELMTGIRQDVAVKIFGENMDTLLAYANQIAPIIASVEGTTAPMVEKVSGLPQIVIHYNRAQIANYGLNIEAVNHIVSTAFAGGVAGVVYENERRFDLVVRLDSAYRSTIDDVSHLYIPLADGTQIPLSQLAEIKMEMGPAQISREGGRRRVVIGFNVKDRDVASVVKDIQQQLDEKIKLSEGYYYTYGGAFENLQAASDRLLIAVPVALALIFMLLYFTFHSVSQATLIFTAIPMAAIGGVFALLLRDMPFSISAGVGFIALFGVAVLNGIVLMATFNQLEKEGISDVLQRIKEGTRMRLRPVLMTATVASLGFLPMALSQGAGAEVQKPLATVVIGGLITATFLTLFVLPLFYLVFQRRKPLGIKPANVVTLLLLCLFSGFGTTTFAQPQVLTLDEALELALRNNPELKARKLEVQAAQSLQNTAFELPKTALNFQYGNNEGFENNDIIQVSQTIPFPSLFGAKKNLALEQVKGKEWISQLSENELKKQVRTYYYQLEYLTHNARKLYFLDSIYAEFERIAALRYQAGDLQRIETKAAETKRGEIMLLYRQNELFRENAYRELKNLLQITDEFSIVSTENYQPVYITTVLDTSLISAHPMVQTFYQEAKIAEQGKKVERAGGLPDLSIGYSNISLIGMHTKNGVEQFYDRSQRFSYVDVGIAIPLTYGATRARIRALDFQQQSAETTAQWQQQQLQTRFENALRQYEQDIATYTYFKEKAVPNAEEMLRVTQLGYKTGAISYVEYLFALQTVTDIQLSYLTSIQRINESVVLIYSLINN